MTIILDHAYGSATAYVPPEPICPGAKLSDAKSLVLDPYGAPMPDTYGNIGMDMRRAIAHHTGEPPLVTRIRACDNTSATKYVLGQRPGWLPSRPSFGVWTVLIQANGVRIAQLRCVSCCKIARTIGERKIYKDGGGPVAHDYRDEEECERCGETGVELHHWAPRHLFDDADGWPMGMLCRACHMEWHRIVTPKMSQRGAA